MRLRSSAGKVRSPGFVLGLAEWLPCSDLEEAGIVPALVRLINTGSLMALCVEVVLELRPNMHSWSRRWRSTETEVTELTQT